MLSSRPFDTIASGDRVDCWTLRNAAIEVEVLTFGARLHSLLAPDRSGDIANVVRGPVDLAGRLADLEFPYAGAIVGRWANRLADGRVMVDGTVHRLAPNEGSTTLHGGPESIDRLVWQAEPITDATSPSVRMRLTSPDGDNGFPATLEITVTYRLAEPATLVIEIEATADAPTVANLTTHTYWNLGPDPQIGSHRLQVPADRVVAVDADLLPVDVRPVDGTPFDRRQGPALGDVLVGVDIDHCLVLDGSPAAILTDPVSGRRMTIDTDQPAIQVYGGGLLPSRHAAVALEPEIAPDAPNRPDLDLGPRGLLGPGDVYRHVTTIAVDTI